MNLDIRTLAILMAITSLAGAVALYLFYRLLPKEPGLRNASIGAAFQSAASILLISRDFIPPVISIVGGNLFYFLAYAFLYQTTREFRNKPTEWKVPGTIVTLLTIPLFFTTANEYLTLRINLSAIGISTLSFMAAWVLTRKGPPHLPAHKGVALALLSIALICVYRIININTKTLSGVPFLDRSDESYVFVWGVISVIIYVVTVIIMTSERLRYELQQQLAEAERSRQVADNALREQKNFIAMLSHEFRTPLGIIRANTDAIREINPATDQFTSAGLSRINNATHRLTSMVNGCLNDDWISHIVEHGDPVLHAIDLQKVLTNLAEEYDVSLDCRIDDPADFFIAGDPNLIPILFSSLIDNASKYANTSTGVGIRCYHESNYAMIEIRDDGPGISDQELPRIFDKYYRIKNGNKNPGTGLGLYFVKRITEQHQGKITVENHDGALFRVSLPLMNQQS